MHLRWEAGQLIESDGHVRAYVLSDVLCIGSARLLIETSIGTLLGFRARATGADGAVYTMHKPSVTLQRLDADCAGRSYTCQRRTWWSKTRDIYREGTLQATLTPHRGGKAMVEVVDESASPTDLVFLTYCCCLVDSPTVLRTMEARTSRRR